MFRERTGEATSILQVNRVGVGGYWNLQNFQIGLPAGTVYCKLVGGTLWTLFLSRGCWYFGGVFVGMAKPPLW